MTHLIKSLYSDKAICSKSLIDAGRADDDVSTNYEKIDCAKCIEELERVVRKLKNGAS
jgi:hypothetical protein